MRAGSVPGSVGHRDFYRYGDYRRPRSKALLTHRRVLELPFSTLAAQPSELPDDQGDEDDSGDSHEHPDAPQDIGC